MPQVFREIHVIGPDTPERVVRAGCPAMEHYGMWLAGLTDAGRSYRMQRVQPTMTHVLVSVSGEGEVWIDDAFQPCGPNRAYISPVGVPMAFAPKRGRRWQFAWLFYTPQHRETRQAFGARHCQLVDAEAWPMVTAIEGLYHESVRRAQPTMMDRWTELIQSQVVRLLDEADPEPALGALWEQVDRRIAHRWMLRELADAAGMSRERLRVTCQRRLGRSPMAQVTHLRMQRAAALLSTTTRTVESIGRDVGYPRLAAFCTAFRRTIGQTPNGYRTAHRA